jgi:lipoprotein signal peptidase
MSLLLFLLATNAFFHGLVVARFGVRNHNQPFFIFALVDAALAIAVCFAVPYALCIEG